MEIILTSIKKLLGVEPDDKDFDDDIIIYINGAIMVLTQLGVGPPDGFVITSSTTWIEFIGQRKDLEAIRSEIYLRVRLIFDPPQNSFLVEAITKQIAEYDWRINVQSETPVI
jgi:hypothetical protein